MVFLGVDLRKANLSAQLRVNMDTHVLGPRSRNIAVRRFSPLPLECLVLSLFAAWCCGSAACESQSWGCIFQISLWLFGVSHQRRGGGDTVVPPIAWRAGRDEQRRAAWGSCVSRFG